MVEHERSTIDPWSNTGAGRWRLDRLEWSSGTSPGAVPANSSARIEEHPPTYHATRGGPGEELESFVLDIIKLAPSVGTLAQPVLIWWYLIHNNRKVKERKREQAGLAKSVLKDGVPGSAARPNSIAIEIMCYNYASLSFSPYGDYWRQMRKIRMSELLSAKTSAPRKPVNLTEKASSLTSDILCRAVYGKVCKDRDGLVGLMRAAVKLTGGFEIVDLYPTWRVVRALSWSRMRLVKMRQKVDVILDDIIREHKETKTAGKDGDLFSAETESSSIVIDWTMVELMRNPRVMAKAQAEIRQAFQKDPTIEEHDLTHKLKYLKLVIKESMRLHPPIPIILSLGQQLGHAEGPTILEGSREFVPKRFEDGGPDFMNEGSHYLPFGMGKRMCPGMMFDLASIELPLARLLYSFDWKLPEGVRVEDLDMTKNPGVTASRKDKLFLVAIPYKPST
ncbi:cytochrome P450 [Striga asiatica]|uniref:Cytochrome P450 n=1 Tax=Striga asiatica TaxID=4170 RepID=A0A5A7QIC4_STRAF|nr:cytochrome P450 [Striga asiatica]